MSESCVICGNSDGTMQVCVADRRRQVEHDVWLCPEHRRGEKMPMVIQWLEDVPSSTPP